MKITQEQQKKGQKIYQELIEKVWDSTTFKEQLIQNPKSTLERLIDKNIPKNTKIIVEDQSDEAKIYLNIPKQLKSDDFELNDSQLEMVAGGFDKIDILLGAGGLGIAMWAGYRFAEWIAE